MPTSDQKMIHAEQGMNRPTSPNNPMSVFSNEKMEVYDQTDLSFESIPAEEKDAVVKTKRGLSARHIQMISLGGCIG